MDQLNKPVLNSPSEPLSTVYAKKKKKKKYLCFW